jgi:outer membrane receptor protein involved in Fe transport
MRNNLLSLGRVKTLSWAVGAILAATGAARAQEQADEGEVVQEIVAVGRFLSAAESLSAERVQLPVSADFLGADAISRTGDPDIGLALRRVPGLTLVDNKYVYVRGLGERYSNVLFNGAAIPSPSLTRSVVPLDIFPTSIVESIKIQKSPSPDVPAAFGGGMIDVRTISVPPDVVASFDFGFGYNSASNDQGLTSSGSSPLPPAIADAINTYTGNISVSRILSSLRATNPVAPISEAQAIHQGLLDSLSNDVGIRTISLDPDIKAKVALGDSWDIGDNWTFGALLNATYDDKWRNQSQHRVAVGTPVNFTDIERTTHEEKSVGALQIGASYLSDHDVQISHYTIQDDEYEAAISRGYDNNYNFPQQKVGYRTRPQERELNITQISGSHTFLETPWATNFLEKRGWENFTFDWFYTESDATNDLHNETSFQALALLDPNTAEQLSTQLFASTSSGQFSYLSLKDRQDSWGGNLSLPLSFDSLDFTVAGGWWGTQKVRDYYQYNVNLNSVGVQSSFLSGTPADVLAPDNLTVANGFDLSLGSQFGTESYLAAQTVDSGYLSFDMDWETWRFMVGARQEVYRQAVMPIDLIDFTGSRIRSVQADLLDPNQRLAIQEQDTFASTALTYNRAGALGSDDFQLRIGFGQTIVRPDLREIADVAYIDPELDIRVRGNPALRSSPIDNFEIRSEFYYGSGDNFTISLFYKDIQSPIEQIRAGGSDDDVVLSYTNADSGEVTGIEFEGLKSLPAGLFVSGNVTLSDSKIKLDPTQSTVLTNFERRMTGHSEWVVNTTLGWDSNNARHSAYLNYNAFGDRIFYAGTGGNDDAYEQPFHTLGIVYKYYPTDSLQIQFKFDNILDENREFAQKNANGQIAPILVEEVGRTMEVGVRWAF